MKSVKLIDVTLRDGGYKTNFHFTNDVIKKTLTLLDQAGIDYIEVGYRNGSFRPIPNIGPAGMCHYDYLEFCKYWIKKSKLTTIFHPVNVSESDIKEMKNCGVECVRICFPMQNPFLGFNSIEMIRKYDLEFFVNITRVSQYNYKKILNIINEISEYDPSGIYLADSNGSLIPEDVDKLFGYLQNKNRTSLGFHAHDNLFSAQANAIAAIQNGVQFIDASLFGLGKGAGNLRTEGFVSFLLSKNITRYDLGKLLVAAEFIKARINDADKGLVAKDIIMGIFDLSQDDAINIGSFSNTSDYYNRAENYHKHIKTSKDTNAIC